METNQPADELPPEAGSAQPESAATPAPEPTPEVAPAENLSPAAPSDDTPADAEPPENGDAPGESSPEGAAEVSSADDPLADLATRSQAARLSPAEEERMGVLLREALGSGKAGVARAAQFLPKLPWIVGVRAVETAWPELKATSRTQLLKALGEEDSDAARRIRLSIARALVKADLPVALKLAVAVAKEIRDKETGALSQKSAQNFSNVFIGKAKPWLTQLPLAELKPADADLFIHCAVVSVFMLQHAPVAQLGVLKWTAEAGRLGKLHPHAIELVVKTVSRWSAKWQNALRNEVPELPEEILGALRPPEATPAAPEGGEAAAGESSTTAESAEGAGSSEEAAGSTEAGDEAAGQPQPPQKKERPVYEPRPQKPQSESQREQREPRPQKERPVYQPRGGGVPQNFNLSESLRHIEAHVQQLRSELESTRAKLKRDDDRPSRKQEKAQPIPGEQSAEELLRLNQQLESRNAELQQRIVDLLADAEDRAASMGAHSDQPAPEPDQQLRTLLGLKLQEDFADFLALESESTGVVVQQHYRSLLRHIFEVLEGEGVAFKRE